MQIPDVGTAGILYRLFKHLDEYGVVVVATSNRAPADLYQGHFRETLFEPFVQVLEDRLHVQRMCGETDYRLMMADHLQHQGKGDLFGDPCYVGPDADDKLDATWELTTQGQVRQGGRRGGAHCVDGRKGKRRAVAAACHRGFRFFLLALSAGLVRPPSSFHPPHPSSFMPQRKRPSAVQVFGRNVAIPESIETGVARFNFKELCAEPLGPADYLAIARTFNTVFIRGIPRVGAPGGVCAGLCGRALHSIAGRFLEFTSFFPLPSSTWRGATRRGASFR